MNNILYIVAGLILLTSGRKLYWLFTGIAGFAAGLYLASIFVRTDLEWLHWLIAILVGILGAVLARVVQKVAVGVAGFLAGGYGLIFLLNMLNVHIGEVTWPFFLGGGLVGLVLVLTLLEVALILLTTWAGATLVVQGTTFTGWLETLTFFVLLFIGLGTQFVTLRAEGKKEKDEKDEKDEKG
jgi:hypothetical protein